MKIYLYVLFFATASVFAEAKPLLTEILNPDGTIIDGTSGSYDPTGFQMTYMEDGTPIFTNLENQNSASIYSNQETRGAWFALGSGLNGTVDAIATSGSNVYVGGNFTNAGGDPSASYIARWDGSNWHSLGVGIVPDGNQPVKAITVSGSDVYVGGEFMNAGANPDADNIARWDGSSWHSLGTEFEDAYIQAIAVTGSDVYIGGTFYHAGDNPDLNYIARWDGSNWNPLGNGLDTSVFTIAVKDSDIYVGGYFEDAGGNPNADHIARWDGSSWNSLAAGLNSTVRSIVVSGDDLYVGGQFDNAGGNPNANAIARWDGSNWHALGTEVEYGQAYSLVISGSDLYAGGSFGTPQHPLLDGVIKWDGSSWNPLGSSSGGYSPAVYGVDAIAIFEFNLYAGGSFLNAGDVPNTAYIAGWDISASGIESQESQYSILLTISPNPSRGDVIVEYNLSQPSLTELSIYDLSGRRVSSTTNGESSSGSHQVQINNLSQGTYLCQLKVGLNSYSQKFVVIR